MHDRRICHPTRHPGRQFCQRGGAPFGNSGGFAGGIAVAVVTGMPRQPRTAMVVTKAVEQSIYTIRGHRVMLDSDLAMLYRVHTKVLVQAVRRNTTRFPSDFMFRLTSDEFQILRSQSVTSKAAGGRRHLPY